MPSVVWRPVNSLKKLEQCIVKDYREGRLPLPSMPDIAFRIYQAIREESLNAQQLGRLMQAEPALTARLIQVANSTRYIGSGRVDSCHGAITKLGLGATRNLAVSILMRNAYQSRHPVLKTYLNNLWEHSSRVAAVAFVLAGLTPGFAPDRALLGGLVHNIGALPVVYYLERSPELLLQGVDVPALLARLSGPLGSVLLRQWRFDAELVDIPRYAGQWDYAGGDSLDYVELVLVARAHALLGRALAGEEPPPLAQIPAFRKMPISRLGPDASIELIDEANDEMALLLRLLRMPATG